MRNISAEFLQAVGVVGIGIALVATSFISWQSTRSMTQSRTLQVTGKASQQIPPDQSIITVTWQEKAEKSDQARANVEAATAKGIAALKSANIDESKITTTQANVYQEYNYDTTGRVPTAIGYIASTTVQVVLSDATRAAEIINLMIANQAYSASGPSLGLSTEVRDQIQKDLKAAAVLDATNQGKILAAQAGAKLGKVMTIDSSNMTGEYPQPTSWPVESKDLAVQSSESDISIGEQELSVTVNLTFQLK